jgi:hypothetical protein
MIGILSRKGNVISNALKELMIPGNYIHLNSTMDFLNGFWANLAGNAVPCAKVDQIGPLGVFPPNVLVTSIYHILFNSIEISGTKAPST